MVRSWLEWNFGFAETELMLDNSSPVPGRSNVKQNFSGMNWWGSSCRHDSIPNSSP